MNRLPLPDPGDPHNAQFGPYPCPAEASGFGLSLPSVTAATLAQSAAIAHHPG
jgi:hypothetical protein